MHIICIDMVFQNNTFNIICYMIRVLSYESKCVTIYLLKKWQNIFWSYCYCTNTVYEFAHLWMVVPKCFCSYSVA